MRCYGVGDDGGVVVHFGEEVAEGGVFFVGDARVAGEG